jgi:YbgC/YbaW family acyl-CoA thioester hydrolase
MSHGTVTFQVRVPPRHCDAQGMMHASRPYEYVEDAFLAWLDDACGGYRALRAAGYDFVIVETRCSYLRPARLDDVLTIEVRPVSRGRSAFTVARRLGVDRRYRTPVVHRGPLPRQGRPDRRMPAAPARRRAVRRDLAGPGLM